MSSIATPTNINSVAQSEYFRRPADQRFESIDTLQAAVDSRRARSVQSDLGILDLTFHGSQGGVRAYAATGALGAETLAPTHYSFGQLSTLLGAGTEFMRKLGAHGEHSLVAQNLNTALRIRGREKTDEDKASVKLMAITPTDEEYDVNPETPTRLQAVTSTTYGRIWDADVVQAVQRILDVNPQYENPKEWGGRRGGLYASDRDVFLLYVDGGSIVDGGADLRNGGDGDQLHRGFIVSNSEVGTRAFSIACFLFRWICGNHAIHGIEGAKVLNIRHTSGGPERFVTEALPALKEYTTASARPIEQTVKAAKVFILPAKDEDFTTFFRGKGFQVAEIKRAKHYAETEEGGSRVLWQMVNGFTRAARDLSYMDARTDLEKRAGKLLEIVKVAA